MAPSFSDPLQNNNSKVQHLKVYTSIKVKTVKKSRMFTGGVKPCGLAWVGSGMGDPT